MALRSLYVSTPILLVILAILLALISAAPYKQGWSPNFGDYEMQANDVINSDPWSDQWQQRKHHQDTHDWLSDYSESAISADYDVADNNLAALPSHRHLLRPEQVDLDWRILGQALAQPSDDSEEPLITRKRSPACIKRCVEQGALHPIQCHSLC